MKENKKLNKTLKIMFILLVALLVISGIYLTVDNMLYMLGYEMLFVGCNSHSMYPELKCHRIILGLWIGDLLVFKNFETDNYREQQTYYDQKVSLPDIEKIKSEIKEGDIIEFILNGISITHRVVGKCVVNRVDSWITSSRTDSKQIEGVITKGDFNANIDSSCVPYYDVKGKLIWHS